MATDNKPISDLSSLIENKINKRNELAQKIPRPDALIKYLDNELDILEGLETYISEQNMRLGVIIHTEARKAFERGKQSGWLLANTGRDCPF